MIRQNQASIISAYIEELMYKGMTSKTEIYAKTVKDLNVPQPTVRRVARDLRAKLTLYSEILGV